MLMIDAPHCVEPQKGAMTRPDRTHQGVVCLPGKDETQPDQQVQRVA